MELAPPKSDRNLIAQMQQTLTSHIRPMQQEESTNMQGRHYCLQSNLSNWPLIWALPSHTGSDRQAPELPCTPQQSATDTAASFLLFQQSEVTDISQFAS